jgi:hypothetical protein
MLELDRIAAHPLVQELVKNVLLSAFEPGPMTLPRSDEPELLRAKRIIKRADATSVTSFREPAKRSSFLGACLDLTDGEDREHLIVGYGIKHGNTTRIEAVHHALGEQHSVRPTTEILNTVLHHIQSRRRGEIVIFHNHPQTWLNTLLDNAPIASSADRQWLERLRFNPYQFAKMLLGNGDVLFFLGENGFVKKFSFPSFDRIFPMSTPQ